MRWLLTLIMELMDWMGAPQFCFNQMALSNPAGKRWKVFILNYSWMSSLCSLGVSDGVLMEYFLLRRSRAAFCYFSLLTNFVLDGADYRDPVSRYARRRRFDCTCGKTGIPCLTCPGQIYPQLFFSFEAHSGSCDILLGCDLC